jgi:hypothetical protein
VALRDRRRAAKALDHRTCIQNFQLVLLLTGIVLLATTTLAASNDDEQVVTSYLLHKAPEELTVSVRSRAKVTSLWIKAEKENQPQELHPLDRREFRKTRFRPRADRVPQLGENVRRFALDRTELGCLETTCRWLSLAGAVGPAIPGCGAPRYRGFPASSSDLWGP